MNPLKSPLHRTTALLAGTLIGLAGAVALAAPASAHHPIIEPTSACVAPDGSWKASWKLSNSEADLEARVSEVNLNPEDSTITGIAVDNMVPKWGTGELTGVQTSPATAKRAVLRVTLIWDRPDEDVVVTAKGKIEKPTTACATPPTSPSPSPSPSSPSPSPSPSPSSPSPSPSESNTPPTSPTPDPSESATPPPSSDEPEFVFEQTCDTLTVGIDNPATGKPETVTFTPSVGEPKTVTAAPGEVKTVDFPASEGLTVEAVPASAPDEAATIAYEAPDDCDDSGDGGPLPVTGVAIGGIAGGAALLLAGGVALFVMARRRKVKFTA